MAGMKRPKETATMRLKDWDNDGGGKEEKESRWWRGRERDVARVERGTSRRTLYPLPVGLGGRAITLMDWIRLGLWMCSLWRAWSEAQLKVSEPKNRMRRGSEGGTAEETDVTGLFVMPVVYPRGINE